MGSKHLERIQAIIEELTAAKKSGAEEQVAAALQALSAPLPPEVKLEQGPQVRVEQTLRHAGALRRIEEVGHGAEGITAAFTAVNIILGEQLGIEPPAVDQALETGLGLAVQAGQFFLDPETGIVIRGEKVGELRPKDKGVAVISALSKAGKPLGQTELTAAIFGEKTDKRPAQARAVVSKINAWAQETGLPQPVERAAETGYALAAAYQIIGTERPMIVIEPSPAELLPSGEVRPESLPIREVLKIEGIAGILNEQQVRKLTQDLLRQKAISVGVELAEGKAQKRGVGGNVVRDLEFYPEMIETLKWVAESFGAQGKIYSSTVVRRLEERKAAKTGIEKTRPQVVTGSPKFIVGKKIVEETGVTQGALDQMEELGVLAPDTDVVKTEAGKRKYAPSSLGKAKTLMSFAKDKKYRSLNENRIREAFGLPPALEWENPHGPNGAKAADNDLVEYAISSSMLACLTPDEFSGKAPIEKKTGKEATENTKKLFMEIAMRKSELEGKLGIGPTAAGIPDAELPVFPSGTKEEAYRLAAATLAQLDKDAREFNFIRGRRPTLEHALAFIRGFDEIGRPDLKERFIESIANPLAVEIVIAKDGLITSNKKPILD